MYKYEHAFQNNTVKPMLMAGFSKLIAKKVGKRGRREEGGEERSLSLLLVPVELP